MSVIWINSGRFAVASAYDTDAQNYITAVEGASYDNTPLETATKNAINTLVLALKADNIWTNAVQIILPCGPRSLAAAAGLALKGINPTNNGFTNGDYNRKTGLGAASNTSKWLDSNIASNGLLNTSHAIAAYGNFTGNSGNKMIAAAYVSSPSTVETSLLILDEWTAYANGRGFRSGTFDLASFPISTSTAAASCMIGSRTSATSATLYVNGTATTNATNIIPSFTSAQLAWFAYRGDSGVANAFSSSPIQVGALYSTGLNATQATAFRSAAAAYVSAIAAAF
jgi:hypothetical protein